MIDLLKSLRTFWRNTTILGNSFRRIITMLYMMIILDKLVTPHQMTEKLRKVSNFHF